MSDEVKKASSKVFYVNRPPEYLGRLDVDKNDPNYHDISKLQYSSLTPDPDNPGKKLVDPSVSRTGLAGPQQAAGSVPTINVPLAKNPYPNPLNALMKNAHAILVKCGKKGAEPYPDLSFSENNFPSGYEVSIILEHKTSYGYGKSTEVVFDKNGLVRSKGGYRNVWENGPFTKWGSIPNYPNIPRWNSDGTYITVPVMPVIYDSPHYQGCYVKLNVVKKNGDDIGCLPTYYPNIYKGTPYEMGSSSFGLVQIDEKIEITCQTFIYESLPLVYTGVTFEDVYPLRWTGGEWVEGTVLGLCHWVDPYPGSYYFPLIPVLPNYIGISGVKIGGPVLVGYCHDLSDELYPLYSSYTAGSNNWTITAYRPPPKVSSSVPYKIEYSHYEPECSGGSENNYYGTCWATAIYKWKDDPPAFPYDEEPYKMDGDAVCIYNGVGNRGTLRCIGADPPFLEGDYHTLYKFDGTTHIRLPQIDVEVTPLQV